VVRRTSVGSSNGDTRASVSLITGAIHKDIRKRGSDLCYRLRPRPRARQLSEEMLHARYTAQMRCRDGDGAGTRVRRHTSCWEAEAT